MRILLACLLAAATVAHAQTPPNDVLPPVTTQVKRDGGVLPYAQINALLGKMARHGEGLFRMDFKVDTEKTKLALSLLVAGRHNLLLLDEPTNNLDPPSREAVAAALASWGGTMVIVSHDIGFVRDLAPDRALLMPDGDVDFWSDDLLESVSARCCRSSKTLVRVIPTSGKPLGVVGQWSRCWS